MTQLNYRLGTQISYVHSKQKHGRSWSNGYQEWVVVSQSLSHLRVLRMGRAESQILVKHSHLTNFGWSGELHHDLHLVTLTIQN